MSRKALIPLVLLGCLGGVASAAPPQPLGAAASRPSSTGEVRLVGHWMEFSDDAPAPPTSATGPAARFAVSQTEASAALPGSPPPPVGANPHSSAGHAQACGPGCVDCCHGGGFLSRFWVHEDYLVWRVSGQALPPLVTASPLGTPLGQAGVLPGATVLFGGDDNTDDDFRSGGRIRFGLWLDDCHQRGIEGSFYALEKGGTNFFVSSDGNPAIGVPFFNIDPAVLAEDAAVLALIDPNSPLSNRTGSVRVTTSSDVMSAGVLNRWNYYQCGCLRVDLLGGYRFFRLDEGLTLDAQTTLDAAPQPNIRFIDDFNTVNEFHGGEIGASIRRDFCHWSLDVTGKLAFGNNSERLRVRGLTAISVAGLDPIVREGGLFAQSTNIGDYEENEFALLHELEAKLIYHVNDRVRATAGWSYAYLSHALRPGQQIDRVVDGRLLLDPNFPATRPRASLDARDVWLYGLSFGLELGY